MAVTDRAREILARLESAIVNNTIHGEREFDDSPYEAEETAARNELLALIEALSTPAMSEADAEEWIVKAYERGYDEGAHDALEDGETPHKDCKGEGCGNFLLEYHDRAVDEPTEAMVEAVHRAIVQALVEETPPYDLTKRAARAAIAAMRAAQGERE